MRQILLVMVIALLLVPGVWGQFSLTFQNPSDFVEHIQLYEYGSPGPIISWVQNTTGGNSYVYLYRGAATSPYGTFMINADPELSTYAAATIHPIAGASEYPGVVLLDSGMNVLYTSPVTEPENTVSTRYEVIVTGNKAYVYRDGVYMISSGTLAVNPSYIGFGAQWNSGTGNRYVNVDDYVYGTDENRNIFGMPASGDFYLSKNMLNSAASGFYFSNGTLVSSYNMTSTWGVGNLDNSSRTVVLQNFGTGQVVCTYTTTAGKMAGPITWPLNECLFSNPTAQYGYYVTTIAGTGKYSDPILYKGDGANIAFDSSQYSPQETATITWTVQGGGYWNPAVYTYRVEVLDVYGEVQSSQSVTSQTGSTTYTFGDAANGVYYAVMIATPIAGGDDIWMAADSTEVTSYLSFYGYVNSGPAEIQIPVANVSISQSTGYFNNMITIDGNYSTTSGTPFTSGSALTFNVTASGYRQYLYTFTPLTTRSKHLNFTLTPISPTTNGIAVGGVFNDNVYGDVIPSCTAYISNSTYSELYSVLSNSVGYYQADYSDGISFTNGRLYHILGSCSGYRNSTTYEKTVVVS